MKRQIISVCIPGLLLATIVLAVMSFGAPISVIVSEASSHAFQLATRWNLALFVVLVAGGINLLVELLSVGIQWRELKEEERLELD